MNPSRISPAFSAYTYPSLTTSPEKRATRGLFNTSIPSAQTLTVASDRTKNCLTTALQSPSDGLDVEMLRKQAMRLGLPEEESEQLVIFANLLAAQNLLSKIGEFSQETERLSAGRLQVEARYGQVEARYGQAEARYGQAEARRAEALERVLTVEKRAFRLETLASRRYLSLVELRGSVNLRDELKEILDDGAAELVTRAKSDKQPRPSVLAKWTFIFREAANKENQKDEESLMECCRAADKRLGSAEKAAAAMVRIIENLDMRVHRSLPAEVIKRIGGIAIEESALLGTQDCKLIECVMRWAAKPCRIISQEEISELLRQEARGSASQDVDGLPSDSTVEVQD